MGILRVSRFSRIKYKNNKEIKGEGMIHTHSSNEFWVPRRFIEDPDTIVPADYLRLYGVGSCRVVRRQWTAWPRLYVELYMPGWGEKVRGERGLKARYVRVRMFEYVDMALRAR